VRILYISRESAPGDHGGAVHTWQVASLLATSDQVTLLCHRLPGQPGEESRAGLRVVRANMAIAGRSLPMRALGSLCQLGGPPFAGVIERFDTFGGLGSLYARRHRVPLLLEVNYPHLEEMRIKWRHRRGVWPLLAWWLAPLGLWNSWQLGAAAAIVAPRASIVPERFRARVHLAHWGADVEHFTPGDPGERERDALSVRQDLGLGRGPVVVLHGSFRPWHGTGVLPEVIARVVGRHRDVSFMLLGQGPGIVEIREQVGARGLDQHCRFTGLVPYAEIPRYLRSADVALAPFSTRAYPPLRQFGFFWSPAKVFEYMACALPIVTTDQDYLRQVVGASGAGRCVGEDDPQALAAACLELLANPELRSIMGGAGRAAAEQRFSWQAHVTALRAILARHVPNVLGGGL